MSISQNPNPSDGKNDLITALYLTDEIITIVVQRGEQTFAYTLDELIGLLTHAENLLSGHLETTTEGKQAVERAIAVAGEILNTNLRDMMTDKDGTVW